ncbi:hypothetical protein ACFUAC_01655 [Streptomyces sp. NPDC057148]|uniref:hypothetical protein n=1 Tax=unclassified Streptomyces TaxID=2593676 RepID=UPI0036354E5D
MGSQDQHREASQQGPHLVATTEETALSRSEIRGKQRAAVDHQRRVLNAQRTPGAVLPETPAEDGDDAA